MMSSLSMGDFISPTGSSLSPLDGSALRVSHEHTDSGLGADQDYAYSSERYGYLILFLLDTHPRHHTTKKMETHRVHATK